MKEFRIGVCEEQGGYLTVTAKNQAEAEELALELVDEHGLDNLPKEYNFEKTSRETFTC